MPTEHFPLLTKGEKKERKKEQAKMINWLNISGKVKVPNTTQKKKEKMDRLRIFLLMTNTSKLI